MTILTRAISLNTRQSSQGTFEPITPVCYASISIDKVTTLSACTLKGVPRDQRNGQFHVNGDITKKKAFLG